MHYHLIIDENHLLNLTRVYRNKIKDEKKEKSNFFVTKQDKQIERKLLSTDLAFFFFFFFRDPLFGKSKVDKGLIPAIREISGTDVYNSLMTIHYRRCFILHVLVAI